MMWKFTEALWKIGENRRFFARFSQRLDGLSPYRKSEAGRHAVMAPKNLSTKHYRLNKK